jgi:uncharacterized protein YigE (DUF2233 family)
VDEDGNAYTLLDSIVDHKKENNAVEQSDSMIVINGKVHPKRTTKGWNLCLQSRDGSTSWVPLKDIKESHPIQVA